MIEVSIASLDQHIKEKYDIMSSAHISLCVDILMLLKVASIKNKTYIDALELVTITERSIKLAHTQTVKVNAK